MRINFASGLINTKFFGWSMVNYANRIFVYGSLREGFHNEMEKILHENSLYLGLGYIHGRMFDLGHYPGVLLSENPNDKIIGDIFEIKDAAYLLPKLDEYEGIGPFYEAPNEYIRKLVDVYTDNDQFQCWAYIYNRDLDDAKFILGGDYLSYVKRTMSL